MKKYIVIAKHRQQLSNSDFNETTRSSRVYDFKIFNTLKEAEIYYKKQFYDDSDYGIFVLIKNSKYKNVRTNQILKI